MQKIITSTADQFTPQDRSDNKEKIIMCPPTYFEVLDVKNAHMQGQVGLVNQEEAKKQWDFVKQSVEKAGYTVFEIAALEGSEDMVFTANPAFVGQNSKGERVALLSNMVHDSRKKEVPPFGDWFEEQGYQVRKLSELDWAFEGNGDAIWHPGKGMIWGGYGFRTKKEVYEEISDMFDVPVCALKLQKEHFYHLDTCFCPLDADTVLYYPEAFDQKGQDLIKHYFKDAIAVSQEEAQNHFACNSLALGKTVFLNSNTPKTVAALKDRGYTVVECSTSEFLKSGGSVCCMKLKVY